MDTYFSSTTLCGYGLRWNPCVTHLAQSRLYLGAQFVTFGPPPVQIYLSEKCWFFVCLWNDFGINGNPNKGLGIPFESNPR